MNSESNELKIDMNLDGLGNIKSQYKKYKKYMRSPIFAIKTMDGTETKIKNLLQYGSN